LPDPSQFSGAFADMTKKRTDALIFLGSSFTLFHRKQLVELATKSRLPTMCSSAAWIDAGCIISYGAILRRNSSISSAINLKRRSVQSCQILTTV